MIDVPVVAYLAFVSCCAVLIPGLRNVRFVGFLAGVSVVLIAAGVLPEELRVTVRVVAGAAVALAIVVAEIIGLGTLTRKERAIDERLEQAEKLAAKGEPGSLRRAVEAIDDVLESNRDIDDRWRAGLRMQRRAWLGRLGESALSAKSATPISSYQGAAARYLSDLRLRRTIGYRPRSGSFEEAIALRAYLDDARSLMPRGQIGPEPIPGPWTDQARAVIEEFRRLPLTNPDALALRELLVDLLKMEIDMRVTAPTGGDVAAYDQLSAHVHERWGRLDAPFHRCADGASA